MTSQTGAAILARFRRDGYDCRSRLRALSGPTLVIHGEKDALPVAVFFSVVDSFLAAHYLGAVRHSV